MKSIYFHEDDYCQIEVLPLSAWEYCEKEMRIIEAFSESHKTDFGWTDIYLRKEQPEPLSTLSISLASLKKSLETIFSPYDEVLTGFSSY